MREIVKKRIKWGVYLGYGTILSGAYGYYLIRLYQHIQEVEAAKLSGPRPPSLIFYMSIPLSLLMVILTVIYNIREIKRGSPCGFWNGLGYMVASAGLFLFTFPFTILPPDSTAATIAGISLFIYPIAILITGMISLLLAYRIKERRYLKGSLALIFGSIMYVAVYCLIFY